MEQQLLEDEPYDCQRLDLINVVGFNGKIMWKDGLSNLFYTWRALQLKEINTG